MMSEAVMNEILRTYVDLGNNPSEAVLRELGQVTGLTELIVRRQYISMYHDATGNRDNPFDLPAPIVG